MHSNYDTLAEEIVADLRIVENVQWRIGDRLSERLPRGEVTDDQVRREIEAVCEAVADKGGSLAPERAAQYMRVARNNPPSRRNGVSFTAAEECGLHPDRFRWYAELGTKLSKREARRRTRGRGENPLSERATNTERAAAVEQMFRTMGADEVAQVLARHLQDPEVANRVASDNDAHVNFMKAVGKVSADRVDRSNARQRQIAPSSHRDLVVQRAYSRLATIRHLLNENLRELGEEDLTEANRELLRHGTELTRSSWDWWNTFIAGDADNLVSQLESFLAGQGED